MRVNTLMTSTRRRRLAAAAAAFVLAVGTAACQDTASTGSGVTPTPVEATAAAPVPEGLESYYGQEVSWYPCGKEGIGEGNSKEGYDCAVIEVPLDYDNPSGETIEIAMKRRPAEKQSIGALFINPGGPGGSGINLVESAGEHFTGEILDSFDVVGFDPRGVGLSTAIECLTDAELDQDRSGANNPGSTDVASAEYRSDLEEYVSWYVTKCEDNTPVDGLLDEIDTVSAARDLDVMRALLGEERLTYLGYSYGTYLGATYADLFPGNVGRLVLDGGIDPTLSAAELTLGQAAGFESALRTYVEDCQSGDGCPLTGDVDSGVKQVQDFLEMTKTNPVTTSNPERPLTNPLARDAILGMLYQSEVWNVLTEGLNQAMTQDDGSTLLAVSDLFSSRNDDGTYTGNGNEAISAINCLDYPATGDVADWEAQVDELRTVSPTFGEDLAYTDLVCQTWGHESARDRAEINAAGAPPIVVVGTTGDPATPYDWSVALADQLDEGVLVTWEGNGHTAYGRSDKCVTDAVDAYLLGGVVPEDGLTCSD